jgi:hypothetical protein
LFGGRGDETDDMIAGGFGSGIADGVQRVRGVEDNGAGTDARPLAFAESFDGTLVDDDDLFVEVLMRRMRLLMGLEGGGVDFELVEGSGGLTDELPGFADVGFNGGNRIPVDDSPAQDGGLLVGKGKGAAGSSDGENSDREVATGEPFHREGLQGS